jgi:hypothetical protein
MWHGMLADLVLVAHLGFVAFVALGAVAVLYRPKLALIHLPCLAYGSALEFIGWVCPLTPLEQKLRVQAGQEGYAGGFVEHYVGGLLYPDTGPRPASGSVWFSSASMSPSTRSSSPGPCGTAGRVDRSRLSVTP